MRILLNKSYQKKFLCKAKGDMSWKKFSEFVGTKEHVIKQCVFKGSTIPEGVYNKIKTHESDKFIIDKLNNNWGQIKGGKNSTGTTKRIRTPKINKNVAEIAGVVLGDGSIYSNTKYGTYQIRIASNLSKENEYATRYLKPLFERTFGISGRITERPKMGVMYLEFDSRELVRFFSDIGLYKKNGVPEWIKDNKRFSAACMRGLIDTDGCIHRLSKKDPNLRRICFKNTNIRLLEDFRNIAINLGFHPSKIIHGNVFLTRKADIIKYIEKIGFSNPKNIKKLKEISPVD